MYFIQTLQLNDLNIKINRTSFILLRRYVKHFILNEEINY